jgi:hypothetical protein
MKKRLTPEEFVQLARQMPLDERVPYAFEKRVLANISLPAVDPMTQWARGLWRAVAPCIAIMAVTAAVCFGRAGEAEASTNLDVDLENAVITPPEPIVDFEP